MNVGTNSSGGIFIGIDFGDMERSMRSRERLKRRAAQSQEQQPPVSDPNFKANRLINTMQEKGNLLDMVV